VEGFIKRAMNTTAVTATACGGNDGGDDDNDDPQESWQERVLRVQN